MKRAIVLLLCLCASAAVTKAQVTADFTTSDGRTGGCSPFTVSFKNTTKGASAAATYKWDLGNNNTSSLQNPGASYPVEKTYTVTLTVTDSGFTSVKTMDIIVYKKPTVDFTVGADKGCAPFTTTFTSTSTPGDGKISNYFWDFGDGVISSDATSAVINHTFNTAQSPRVDLIVTNNYGCQSTIRKTNIIQLQTAPVAVFKADQTTFCKTGTTINFANTSTNATEYAWNFGDGNTSSSSAVSHAYTTKGVYDVTLIAKSNFGIGCADTLAMPGYINIAAFNSSVKLPAALCNNTSLVFEGKSDVPPAYAIWYFSDNAYAIPHYGNKVIKNFANANDYTVRLVNFFNGCTDTVEQKITINKVPSVKGFVVEDFTVCNLPATVNFKDTTAGATSWNWNFGNSTTSNAKNPTGTFTAEDYYTVGLTVGNAAGCIATTNKTIIIEKPAVTIKYLTSTATAKTSGCAGFTVKFAALPASIISTYSWDFGDGTTSTEAQPEHTFTKVGKHTINLSYITKSGCAMSVKFAQEIIVYEKPVADFVLTDTTICGSNLVTFNDKSSAIATKWSWFYGDSSSSLNIGSKTITHRYSDSGNYTVTLIAYNNTCGDTIEKEKAVMVWPLFTSIKKVTGSCLGLHDTVTFNQSSKYVSSSKWDFGDGTSQTFDSTITKLTHNYTKTGTYNVVLTVSNSFCTLYDSATVYVLLKQTPKLTVAKDVICASDSLGFNLTGFEANPYFNTNYTIKGWQNNDGSTFGGTTTGVNGTNGIAYTGTISGFKNGIKAIRVITESANFSCRDTSTYAYVTTKGPVAGFAVNAAANCFKLPVSFNDTSYGTNNVAITSRQWSYGDGIAEARNSGGVFTHPYTNPAAYKVVLKLTDADGCKDSATNGANALQVTGPKAAFTWNPTVIYAGGNTTFKNTSNTFGSPATEYLWNFSAANKTFTGSSDVVMYHNNKIAIDTVVLIAKNPATQCADTVKQVIPIERVMVSFTLTTEYINNAYCPPMAAYFKGKLVNVTTSKWYFGDGTTAENIASPTHTYHKPGIYKVTLVGTGKNGITDTAYDEITIKGPYASIKADVLQNCVPAKITLTASLKNAVVYTWDFGDGTLSTDGDTIMTHIYKTAGMFTPSLIMKDSAGCKAIFELPNKFMADTLHADLMASAKLICNAGNIQFTNKLVSVADTALTNAIRYSWNFGTGNAKDTSNKKSPAFQYTKPGMYPVTLTTASVAGCKAVIVDSIEVSPMIKATIAGPFDTCENSTVQYNGKINLPGNATYNWLFNNTVTDNKQIATPQKFDNAPSPINIRLITTLRGCSDTAFTKLTIHQKPNINLTAKTQICRGDSVKLIANAGYNYQWSSSLAATNVPFAKPAVSTKYNVKATDTYGCVSYDSINIQVVQPFIMSVSRDAVICAGTSTQIMATGANTYKWISANADLNSTTTAVTTATPKATSNYKIIGYDAYGCFSDTAMVKVTVAPLPTVDLGANKIMGTGSTTSFNANVSTDVVKWSWYPATYLSSSTAANPVVAPRSDISYVATVTTQYGCEAKDSISIKLSCVSENLKIPNAFTPNKDGLNETFYPMGKGIRKIKNFAIYNRSGQVIFHKTNINVNDKSAGWDGRFSSYEQPTGVYVYMIEAECDTGDIIPLQGTVTLIR